MKMKNPMFQVFSIGQLLTATGLAAFYALSFQEDDADESFSALLFAPDALFRFRQSLSRPVKYI